MTKKISEKRKSKLYNSNKAKLLVASTIAASVVTGIGVIGDVEKVEANTLYHWEKFSISKVYDNNRNPQEGRHIGYIRTSGWKDENGWDAAWTYFDENWNYLNGGFHAHVDYKLGYTVPGEIVNQGEDDMTETYFNDVKHYYFEFPRISQGTIQASENAYTDKAVHSDGFYYVRGAKVNTAPTVNTIPSQTIAGKGANTSINLSDFFHDVDGNNLTYTVSSSNGNVTPSVNNSNKVLTLIGNNKGSAVITVTANDGNGGIVSTTFTTSVGNTMPTVPSLNVPTGQFEHGDQHIIGWNATDVDNDSITYTLQASYNGGAWENLYNGPAKSYTYTVPNNKGANVKFRVIASDGALTSISAESANKSMREVMYYWSKFNSEEKNEQKITSLGKGYKSVLFDKGENLLYTHGLPKINTNGLIDFSQASQVSGRALFEDNLYARFAYSHLYNGSGYYMIVNDTHFLHATALVTSAPHLSYEGQLYKVENVANGYVKGSLVTNNIQDGFNAFTHGIRNADGFWYERGQRVLASDTTPPIIELTEQSNVGATSTVSVRTHDLGTVNTVKWAQGNRDVNYFASNGTTIGTGQTAASSFNANANGIYTVYAVDALGNKAVQTIEVKKVNSAPIINSVQAADKFNVVDATNNFKIYVNAIDVDRQNLSSRATYGNNQTANSSNLELTLNGSSYSKGFHTSPITVTVNDGIIDSAAMNLENHIVIRVDNASDYMRLLNGHSAMTDNFTQAQYKTFYDAYEAVLAYETGKTKAQYDTAVNAINELKTATDINESSTIKEWNERLAIVFTQSALEQAENSLDKTDYENLITLYDALTLEANKTLLQSRLDELGKYHAANDLLVPMEKEAARHKGDKSSLLDTSIINVENLNALKIEIAKTKNTTEVSYKTILNERYNTLRTYYLNNKAGLTPEDLMENVPTVNPNFTGEYDEFKDAFGDLGENALYLVNYTNAVMKFLLNVNGTTKDEYHSTIEGFPTNTGIDFTKLATVSNVIDNIYAFRSAFRENDTAISNIANDITSAATGGQLIKGYMDQVRLVMKEVTEYNDVELDENHSDTERSEAEVLIALLKDGQFKSDMTDYVTNEIPIVMLDSNPYEYIVNGDIVITGEITDSDDNEHTVTANLGSDSTTQTTNNKKFSLTINRGEGVYLNESLTINVNDGMTNKAVTVKNKPIISVSNPTLYKEMLTLLEEDRNETILEMSDSDLSELIWIMNEMVAANLHSSPLVLRQLYTRTETLSNQQEGQLEQFVKKHMESKYLQWLYDNYLTATVDDFEFAGVTKNGQKVVTYDNIADMKILITDYKNSYAPSIAPVPSIENYITWVEMLNSIETLNDEIEGIYSLEELSEVENAIDTITQKVNDTVPEWSSIYPSFVAKFGELQDFKLALASVEKAEKFIDQTNVDEAQVLVDAVSHVDAKNALQERIDNVQLILDAISNALQYVQLAESKLADNDNEATKFAVTQAQELVDLLDEGEVKTELQSRLDEVTAVIEARESVEKVENEVMTSSITDAQNAIDLSTDLVNALKSQGEKDALNARLNEVQIIINARKAIEDATHAFLDENQSVLTQAIEDAQAKIDLVSSSSVKTELQNQLDNLASNADALQAVIQAEIKEEQTEKDVAQTVVDLLTDNTTKEALTTRLNEVQKVIDGKDAVSLVESTLIRSDYEIAESVVTLIADSKATKDVLKERLNELLPLIEAIELVEQAEGSQSQNDKDKAQELVDALPESAKKDELNERLEEVQHAIDKKSAEDKAEDKVEKAEESWERADLEDAQKDVEELIDGNEKDSLQDRLNELEKIITLYEETVIAVEKAETAKSDSNVAAAQNKLDELTTLIAGSNDKTDGLQVRIDYVNQYLEAEKAVERAEKLLTEGTFNYAQSLVTALKDSEEKTKLQERLDIITAELTKEKDLIDKIIDNPHDVTSQELADYTDEMVYDEILNEYIDKLIAIGDDITKEQIVATVQVVTALEKAKRSMSDVDIQAYETISNKAQGIISLSSYPTADFLSAVEQYIDDKVPLNYLVSMVSNELGISETDVMEMLEAITKEQQELKFGSYSIQYVDEAGELIHEEVFNEIEYGLQVINPFLNGFEIVSEYESTFELNEETTGQVFTIVVKEIESEKTTEDTAEVEVTTASYTVEYRHYETNELIHTDTFTDVPFGAVSITAKLEGIEELEDYSIKGEDVQTIELTEESPQSTVVFLVEPFDFFEHLPTTKDTAEIEVPVVESEPTESDSIENEPTANINFMRVAGVDNLYMSFSQSVAMASTTVDHKDYVAKTFYALEGVKNVLSQGTAASESYVEQVKMYIVNNLYDGAYKKLLLSLMNVPISTVGNGDDGEADLTPVYPTPPVIEPVEPPVVEPVQPPVVIPTPPIYTGGGAGYVPETPVEEVEEEPATTEENALVENHTEGQYNWTLDLEKAKEQGLFKNGEYTFTAEGISITLPMDDFKDVAKLEVAWIHLGEEHYQLVVKADGKNVTKFSKPVKIVKTHGFAYLVRGQKGDYVAMPYNYLDGQFNFATNNIADPFYFSTTKRTFVDIGGLYSQNAIETLASRYIVFGTSETTYSPNSNITRSQFSAMISRALALEPTSKVASIGDIQSHWASKDIQALYELGIVKGENGSFNPSGELMRRQAVLMIYRLLKAEDVQLPISKPNFKDNNLLESDYELQVAAGTLQALGIFEGDQGYLNPNEKLTRTQMAKVLEKALVLTGKY